MDNLLAFVSIFSVKLAKLPFKKVQFKVFKVEAVVLSSDPERHIEVSRSLCLSVSLTHAIALSSSVSQAIAKQLCHVSAGSPPANVVSLGNTSK